MFVAFGFEKKRKTSSPNDVVDIEPEALTSIFFTNGWLSILDDEPNLQIKNASLTISIHSKLAI